MGVDTADPKLYRQLNVPFDTDNLANDALTGFYEDVMAARIKHKIADVVVISQVSIAIDDDESVAISAWSCGDVLKREAMCAWAYAKYSHEREQMILRAGKQGKNQK